MPFGMVNAPATFQRTMDKLLGDLRYSGVLVYLDDILIHTRSTEDHEPLLLKVLNRLNEADLGHIVDHDGIRPDPSKVEALKNLSSLEGQRDANEETCLRDFRT
eukprot:GHVO01024351.1.p2 GENE.GHVO01024351.1~~GHVO01024351.1.p2  ORF type:complete len:104 (-),score=6.92 GHVO01024351.1:258-569(-)